MAIRADDRVEVGIVVLVMLAAALVLAAPVLGRMGWPTAAGGAMGGAALAGLASWALAAASTLRAARTPRRDRGQR